MPEERKKSYWISSGVEARHVMTQRRYVVMQLIRGDYRHKHDLKSRYTRIYGVKCKCPESGEIHIFHTKELKPA